MYWIKKALVREDSGELTIKLRDVAQNAPINRILDVVGFYSVQGVEINNQKYLITFDDSELYKKKTKCLFTKVSSEGIVSVKEEDFKDILNIARDLMEFKTNFAN